MMQRLGALSDAHREGFRRGEHYWQVWPDLEVMPEDKIVEKGRFSGFTPGTSSLDDELEQAGIDTVIISGTLTNICCESTARDAMQHNYRVIIGADSNAALSDEEHAATLKSLAFAFADLRSSEEVEALLQR